MSAITGSEQIDEVDRAAPWHPGWKSSLTLFAGLTLLLVILSSDIIRSLIDTWTNTTTYNANFGVLPGALFLIWLRRKRLQLLTPSFEPLALVPLAGFSFALLLGLLADVNIVQQLAFVGALISLTVFCFGREVSWEIKFPLFFLLFLVPMGDSLIPHLQIITAKMSVWMLRLSGIPTFLDGILIEIPNGSFLVAEACAGIRFLITNLIIAFLFAHLAYDKIWKSVLFLLLAVGIPILANSIRAYGIMIIAYYTDMEYATGADHIIYGWGFFAVIMLLLLWIGNLFADRVVGDMPTTPVWRSKASARSFGLGLAALAAVLVTAGPAYALYVLNRDYSQHSAPALADIQSFNPAWRRTDNPEAQWNPNFENASANYFQRYESDAGAVDVFTAFYTHQAPDTEVIYYANVFHDEERWIRVQYKGIEMNTGASGLPAQTTFEEIGTFEPPRRVIVSWYWVNETATASAMKAKLAQLKTNLLGGEPAAAHIALSAVFTDDPAEGLAKIEAFLKGAMPAGDYLSAIAKAAKP